MTAWSCRSDLSATRTSAPWWSWERAACWWSSSGTGSCDSPRSTRPGSAAAVDRLRVASVLDGVRGAAPADRAALASAVAALSVLAVELGDHIAALDVNPLRCGPGGCLALDVLVEPV